MGALACAAHERTPNRPPAADRLIIEVVNHNWADMRIYLARGEIRTLLGVVSSGRGATFSAPRDMAAPGLELRLVADPVGSRQVFESDSFLAEPGQTVEWTIRARPDQSRLSVY